LTTRHQATHAAAQLLHVLLCVTLSLDWKALAGQSGLSPLHVSATSQMVVARRHTCSRHIWLLNNYASYAGHMALHTCMLPPGKSVHRSKPADT
jgi:hypothetical protein